MVNDKKSRRCQITDERGDKYQDLSREVGRVLAVRTRAVSVVVGALGLIPRRREN